MLIRLLRERLVPYRRWLAVVVGLQFVSVLAMLYLPSLNAEIIDDGVATGDTAMIWRLGGEMLAISVAQICASIGAAWFGARAAAAFGRDLRRDLFHRIGGYSTREVQQFGAPSLITRTTNDVQQVQMIVVMGSLIAASAPIMMIGGVIMALREDAGLGWILAVVVPVLLLSVGFLVTRMIPGFRSMQARIDEVNRVLREQITGIRVVRAFVREPYENERFAVANRDLTGDAVRAGRWQATMFPMVMLVVNVASVAVIWFGGHRVDDGAVGVGALTAFLSYLMQILMSVMMATFMLMQVPRAAVCADRIAEVLATDTSVVRPAQPRLPDPALRGHLDLDDVVFTYPGAADPVLDGVSLRVRPGQTVAVIGSTGAGKSTLVNLVPRLFDATSGTVAVAGVPVDALDEESLWAELGLVPQRAYLFTGTIRTNLQYGKADATEDEMWDALAISQARDFVEALPQGLDAPVAQGGTNFSGGQRQRLAIARAVVRRPGLYLFDDSFSALDLATDARLRAALRPVTAQAGVVVVAQRVSTIRDADEIVVLEHGRVVGRGRHEELLAACGTYAEIVDSQLSAEEVA
ncbi:ABC transporter ATP-binding protein [Nocardioides sp. R-C-SC26]|uniref:ABC transporter ATP-binding protein n=1 Tax=Nocardioides sp. R-C-SC26 TaxID=2870414 RepID=UPI001E2E1A17|nr:ABC transporter ATP-binding protein [Nocardioides sp. R-C-SC26]